MKMLRVVEYNFGEKDIDTFSGHTGPAQTTRTIACSTSDSCADFAGKNEETGSFHFQFSMGDVSFSLSSSHAGGQLARARPCDPWPAGASGWRAWSLRRIGFLK